MLTGVTMILDNNRHVQIAFIILSENRVITSEELAERLKTTSRTIKNDMAYINDVFMENGAEIISCTNRGYSYEVKDENKFKSFRSRLMLSYYYYSSTELRENRIIFNHIMRTLLASTSGIDLKDLKDELFISERLFNRNFRDVEKFLESHRLQLEKNAEGKLVVTGEEKYLRLCILSVYGIYYNQSEFNISNIEEYNKMFFTLNEEYQDIRKQMLAYLRTSGISIKDTSAQRMALYLNLQKSRLSQGYFISDDSIDEYRFLNETALYDISRGLYQKLAEDKPEFNVSDAEILFFAANLLYNLDLMPSDMTPDRIKSLYQPVYDTTDYLIAALNRDYGLCFEREDLLPVVFRMVSRKLIKMDGIRDVSLLKSYEFITGAPLCVELGNIIINLIEQKIDCKSDVKDVLYCANFVQAVLDRYDLPYHKRVIKIVSSLGKANAKRIAEEVAERFPELIESIEPVELYELRGADWSRIDGVIGDIGTLAFKYDLPYCEVFRSQVKKHQSNIFKTIFLHGYQTERSAGYLDEVISYYRDMDFTSIENAISFIMYKNIPDKEKADELISQALHNNERFNYGRTDLPLFMVTPETASGSKLEFYQLKKPLGKAEGHNVSFLVFLSLDFSRLKELSWAANTLLKQLSEKKSDSIMELIESENRRERIIELLLSSK